MSQTTDPAKKPRQSKGPASGPTPEATTDAQRRAAVILEVLAGVRTAQEAASMLKISSNHYYLLERKALKGLVTACEPAPRRGPIPAPERQIRKLQQELEQCRRDCQRQAALVRAAQRAIGVPVSPEPSSKPSRKRSGKQAPRRRRRQPRALRAAQELHKKLAEKGSIAVEGTVGTNDGQSLPSAQESSHGQPRTQTAGVGPPS